jgi:glucose/arabinose dehydrogenase
MMSRSVRLLVVLCCVPVLFVACGNDNGGVVRVTVEPTRVGQGAPVYTATASFTPSHTPTLTATPTITLTPTNTETPTTTPTLTETPLPSATFTPTATNTLPPSPTPLLMTPTPVVHPGNASAQIGEAGFTLPEGWSCGDFPCADDIDGFLQRIRVAPGFAAEPVGRFPGQVMQITYGSDERLYATVLEDGTLTGAVYVMDADGTTARYSQTMLLPIGLAFEPGTDVLYVSTRTTPTQGGSIWRVLSNGTQELVIADLPCCYLEFGNQPNGMIFGQDGFLYVGVGARTDHSEGAVPEANAYDPVFAEEAAVLRIDPHTGAREPFAQGIRNPFDVAQDTQGNFYATDTGVVSGQADRILALQAGGFYGFPYYRGRGCEDCPPSRAQDPLPDLVSLPDYSLPRGITVYQGDQFPGNMFDTLFVVLWNGTATAQRILWIDPNAITPDYAPVTFMTGLIRPVDVAVASDGSLVVADFIYGHIWRVRYTGETTGTNSTAPTKTAPLSFLTPQATLVDGTSPAEATSSGSLPVAGTADPTQANGGGILPFATNTPAG